MQQTAKKPLESYYSAVMKQIISNGIPLIDDM